MITRTVPADLELLCTFAIETIKNADDDDTPS